MSFDRQAFAPANAERSFEHPPAADSTVFSRAYL